MYDFYLLKLTSEGVEELDENYRDDYEFTALKGDTSVKRTLLFARQHP